MAKPSNDSESREYWTLEKPQTSLGAQELLTVGSPSKQGFLRKQGQFERTFKFLKWRQRFVVLSRGCIYIYKDEYSGSPMKSLSMKVFIKCQRIQGSTPQWAFNMLPENSTTHKTISFACCNDPVRREWMRALTDEMVNAKGMADKEAKRNVSPSERDDYVYLEREVRSPPPPPPPVSATGPESNEDADGEDYCTIDETKINTLMTGKGKRAAAPETKKSAKKEKAQIVKSKPKPPTPPDSPVLDNRQADISRISFQYSGGDRNEVKDILVARPEGTYLVRKSRADNREVLSVNIDGKLKEYKIYERGSMYSIDNIDQFKSVEELLSHYIQQFLPNKSATLYRAYSQTDPGYINS